MVAVTAEIDEGRVVLHDLAVDGGELDHVDRVVLAPTGELEIELPDARGWSFLGGEVERSWELVVRGLPVQEPRIEELAPVALPLVVTAPWPTRPWWPAPALVLVVVAGFAARRGQ